MVKKSSGNTERGKVKIRFFEIEMDGDTETLQEGLHALTSAINKPVSQGQRLLAANGTAPKQISSSTDAIEGEVVEREDEEAEEAEELASSSTPKHVRQRAKRTPPTPEILNNLDFEKGEPSWPAFAESKAPDNDVLRVAVVAAWFKRVNGLDAITIDHAYTAYKFVGWATPDDIGQSFRNAKRSRNWFGTDGAGTWTINIIGLNAVDKLKPGQGA